MWLVNHYGHNLSYFNQSPITSCPESNNIVIWQLAHGPMFTNISDLNTVGQTCAERQVRILEYCSFLNSQLGQNQQTLANIWIFTAWRDVISDYYVNKLLEKLRCVWRCIGYKNAGYWLKVTRQLPAMLDWCQSWRTSQWAGKMSSTM